MKYKSDVMTLGQRKQKTNRRAAAVFIFPALVVLLIFIIYPIIESFRISFYEWNGISAVKKFVGLDNWGKLITDKTFRAAFFNNILVLVLSIVIQLPIALLLATFLNFIGRRGKILKCLWFIPMLMSSVAVGFLFKYVFSTTDGIFTTISKMFGGRAVDLLGSPKYALITVIFIICWQFIPFYMVFFLAAFSGISPEIYEAAIIDGSTKPEYFRYIVLPLLKPAIRNASVLSMVGSLKYFDLIYVITNGGPGTATELMATYMYKLSFKKFNMGYGSAVACGMLIVISVIASLTMKLTSEKQGD